jgi:superfamily II DNA/RNA helicase
VNQLAIVYQDIARYSNIVVENLVKEKEKLNAQVLVSTIGTIKNYLLSRNKRNFSSLKCLVFDEADFFFGDDQYMLELEVILDKLS